MNDLGYGEDIYKLALLNKGQREDLTVQLKPMPGHKAKIAGFFTVIDELYPRQMVIDQIQQATPQKKPTTKAKNILRPGGMSRTKFHLGPKRTLLQQYEKLDRVTKQSFNNNFLMSLEQVNQNMGQIMQNHVDLEESTMAINQVFPPEEYLYGQGTMILEEAQNLEKMGFQNEINDLLDKYSQGPQAQ